MKLVNIPKYIAKDITDYIELNVRDDDFDENRFIDWLFEKDIEHKTNPKAYIKMCLKKEIEAGTFKPKAKVEYIPNTQPLLNDMRDKGICVLADDSVWVNVLFGYLLNNKKVDGGTCRTLNKKILDYMTTKSFSEYKDLIMKSNTLKPYDIDWNYIERETQRINKEWNGLLDDMDKSLESEE